MKGIFVFIAAILMASCAKMEFDEIAESPFNGKEIRFIGVRDRYRTTIPCEYSFVLPTGIYSPFAKCVKYVGEKRDSVVRSVEEGYVLE